MQPLRVPSTFTRKSVPILQPRGGAGPHGGPVTLTPRGGRASEARSWKPVTALDKGQYAGEPPGQLAAVRGGICCWRGKEPGSPRCGAKTGGDAGRGLCTHLPGLVLSNAPCPLADAGLGGAPDRCGGRGRGRVLAGATGAHRARPGPEPSTAAAGPADARQAASKARGLRVAGGEEPGPRGGLRPVGPPHGAGRRGLGGGKAGGRAVGRGSQASPGALLRPPLATLGRLLPAASAGLNMRQCGGPGTP